MTQLRSGAFTMLELIMVIIIIGVLAALAVPQYVSFVEKAKMVEAVNHIGQIKSAEIIYLSENPLNDYSANIIELRIANNTPNWFYSVSSGSGSIAFYADARRNGGPYNNTYITFEYRKNGNHYWYGSYPYIPKD